MASDGPRSDQVCLDAPCAFVMCSLSHAHAESLEPVLQIESNVVMLKDYMQPMYLISAVPSKSVEWHDS